MLRRLALAVGAVILFSAAGAGPVAAIQCDPGDDVCQQLNSARAQQSDLGGHIKNLDAQIKAALTNISLVQALILQVGAQVDAQNAVIVHTQGQIDEVDRQVRFTQADIDRREAHMQVREALLDQRVRSMDKHGSVNYLELVVTAANFSQMVDRLMLMQAIVRSDQRLISDLRVERDQVRQLSGQLVARRADQQALLSKQQRQKLELDQLKAAQQKLLVAQLAAESSLVVQRQQLEAQQQEVAAQVALLQQQYDAAAQAAGGGSGQFGWPETTHYITQPFGCSDLLGEPYSPTCKSHHWHTGIDIGGPGGAPVLAADSGIISFAGGNPRIGYGNYIIITHGNGYSTLYGHLSGFNAGTGQTIRRGAVIGYEGSTGFSTGPHLHFEVRYNGGYVDPLAYLR